MGVPTIGGPCPQPRCRGTIDVDMHWGDCPSQEAVMDIGCNRGRGPWTRHKRCAQPREVIAEGDEALRAWKLFCDMLNA